MNPANQIPENPELQKKPTTAPKESPNVKKAEVKKDTGEKLAQFESLLKREQLSKAITKEDLEKNASHDQQIIEDLKKLTPDQVDNFEKKYGNPHPPKEEKLS